MLVRPLRAGHPVAIVTVAIIALVASACGSGGSGDGGDGGSGAARAADTPSNSRAAPTSAASGGTGPGNGGNVTLTVDGVTTSFPSGECDIIETSDVNLALSNNGLHVSLPATPGQFAEDDYAQVILPPSGSDEYRPTGDVHGKWGRNGDRASGHVEGVAHLLSALTSQDDPDIPFSFDFECPLQDLTAG